MAKAPTAFQFAKDLKDRGNTEFTIAQKLNASGYAAGIYPGGDRMRFTMKDVEKLLAGGDDTKWLLPEGCVPRNQAPITEETFTQAAPASGTFSFPEDE